MWDSDLSLWLIRVMAAVVLPQARWRRKCRSPLQGSALDPWAPRREDSKGSEPDSWGDFRSLTEAPIARLESLDEMESLSVSSWQHKPNHRNPSTYPIPLPALPTPPYTCTHFMHESVHCQLMLLAPISVAVFSIALTSTITHITSSFNVFYIYIMYIYIYMLQSKLISIYNWNNIRVQLSIYEKDKYNWNYKDIHIYYYQFDFAFNSVSISYTLRHEILYWVINSWYFFYNLKFNQISVVRISFQNIGNSICKISTCKIKLL